MLSPGPVYHLFIWEQQHALSLLGLLKTREREYTPQSGLQFTFSFLDHSKQVTVFYSYAPITQAIGEKHCSQMFSYCRAFVRW